MLTRGISPRNHQSLGGAGAVSDRISRPQELGVWLTSRDGVTSAGDLFGNKHVGLMSAYQLSVVMPASTIGPQ